MARKAIAETGIQTIIIDEHIFQKGFIKQILNIFLEGVDVYPIKSKHAMVVKNLFVYQYNQVGGLPLVAKTGIRQTALERIRPNNIWKGKRILVVRKSKETRYISNQEEMAAMLTKHFGFVPVFTEEYSVLEQFEMFHQAQIIISLHGAAFANLIAGSSHTIYFELVQGHPFEFLYKKISHDFGLNLTQLMLFKNPRYIPEKHLNVDTKTLCGLHYGNFEVDIDLLHTKIKEVITGNEFV